MSPLTVQQAYDLAILHHQAGRLRDAEQIYRQILSQHPNHIGAMHHLGVIAHQAKKYDISIDLIRRAIALNPTQPEAYNNLGNVLQAKGQLDDAIAAFRQAIVVNPNLAEAHHNLGLALRAKGQLDDAIAAFHRASTLDPTYPEALNNLGICLREKGRLEEAISVYRQAIAGKPTHANAHTNLGNALKDIGLVDDAIAAYRQALAVAPNVAEAHHNLAIALKDKGQTGEAIASIRHAIALNPKYAEAHNSLGVVLTENGQLDEAIASFRRAIVLNPIWSEVHRNLGHALKAQGDFDQAIAAYRLATILNPHWPEVYNDLALALITVGQPDDAIDACRQAIALRPTYAEAYNNLGCALKDKGRLDDAIAAYRQATALKPYGLAHSNLLNTYHFHPGYDAHVIAEEHRLWKNAYARPLVQEIVPHDNDLTPTRRLRIGYVSPDFRTHCQALFTVPLLSNHDHTQFDIFCYSSVSQPDNITQRLMSHADTWRDVATLSDADLAAQIRRDRVDILIDLTMHMANGRPLLFARKLAPVQVAWLAYPGTTGLETIDYRLSDPYLDPPGSDTSVYTEQTVRLPCTFWCYDPLSDPQIQVNALPALDRGYITFGCLNNFCKVNDPLLAVWSRVLRQVENSRLLLLAHSGTHRRRTLDQFSQNGIDPSRIEFSPFLIRAEYLRLYHRIDIGLDSFPYNGHTTSLDSFWMGVPVITRVGDRVVSRAGLSQLSNLGLLELVAHAPDEFVRIAVELAADLPRLKELRATLRPRMQHSPLMDAPRFARDIEMAYRNMWHAWCHATTTKIHSRTTNPMPDDSATTPSPISTSTSRDYSC